MWNLFFIFLAGGKSLSYFHKNNNFFKKKIILIFFFKSENIFVSFEQTHKS